MYQVANFITVKLSCRSSLIAGLDCGLDRWTGSLDWIAGLDCWTGLLSGGSRGGSMGSMEPLF